MSAPKQPSPEKPKQPFSFSTTPTIAKQSSDQMGTPTPQKPTATFSFGQTESQPQQKQKRKLDQTDSNEAKKMQPSFSFGGLSSNKPDPVSAAPATTSTPSSSVPFSFGQPKATALPNSNTSSANTTISNSVTSTGFNFGQPAASSTQPSSGAAGSGGFNFSLAPGGSSNLQQQSTNPTTTSNMPFQFGAAPVKPSLVSSTPSKNLGGDAGVNSPFKGVFLFGLSKEKVYFST